MSTQRWQRVEVDTPFMADPRAWLAGKMGEDMPWLLVHADDGVIWGKRRPNGSVELSSDVFDDVEKYPAIAVELRVETLQQARVFGPGGELLVWRTGTGFTARLITDGADCPEDAFEEPHLLWRLGTDDKSTSDHSDFLLVREGQQGLQHAPPIGQSAQGRPYLTVRHYVDYDEEGQAYVAMSRLVVLGAVGRGGTKDES